MAINKIPIANLAQYTEEITPNGELHITARDGAVVLDQTIGNIELPALLGYSSAQKIFFLFKINNYEVGYDFVSIITDATTAAGAQVNPK